MQEDFPLEAVAGVCVGGVAHEWLHAGGGDERRGAGEEERGEGEDPEEQEGRAAGAPVWRFGGEAVEETLRGDLGGGLTPHHAGPRAGGTADVHECWVGDVEGDGCCLLVGRWALAVGVWREAVGG